MPTERLSAEELDRIELLLDRSRAHQAHHFPQIECWTVPVEHSFLGRLISQARAALPVEAAIVTHTEGQPPYIIGSLPPPGPVGELISEAERTVREGSWSADYTDLTRRLVTALRLQNQGLGAGSASPGVGENVPSADDALDAVRWRALMRIGRISMQGSAGVHPETGARNPASNVHFGAEFWPETLPQDYREGHPDSAARYDHGTKWGVACLIALADAVLEWEAKQGVSNPSYALSVPSHSEGA